MKRVIFAILAMMLTVGAVSAQNYMVVDSEKVFKSIESYNDALAQVEKLSADYQKSVDEKFSAVETMYNNYMKQRAALSEQQRAEFDAVVKKSAEELLKAGVEVGYSKDVKTGFKVGEKGGGYYISFTDESFDALLKEYLREKVANMLYK